MLIPLCQADQQGRATWLASSNVAVNTVFYNSLGFVTVKQFMLGDDNPTWEETPFPIAIVSAYHIHSHGSASNQLYPDGQRATKSRPVREG